MMVVVMVVVSDGDDNEGGDDGDDADDWCMVKDGDAGGEFLFFAMVVMHYPAGHLSLFGVPCVAIAPKKDPAGPFNSMSSTRAPTGTPTPDTLPTPTHPIKDTGIRLTQ